MSRNIFFAVLLSFFAIFISASTASGQLLGTYPSDGGPISITTTNGPVATSGLEFGWSPTTGSLAAGDSPAPFDSLVDRWWQSPSLGQLRSPSIGLYGNTYDRVVLDGTVTLDILASRGVEIDAVWGHPVANSRSRNHPDGKLITKSPFLVVPNDIESFVNVTGSYAYDGGPITIEPTDPEIPLRVSGLEINIEQGPGELTSGGSSAPFSSLDVNTSRRWSATSDVLVEIDGPITLDLEFKPIGFEPAFVMGKADSETGSGLFPVVRQEPELDDRIRGSYSSQGPILIESTRGPVTLRGLEFTHGGTNRLTNLTPSLSTVKNSRGRMILRSNEDVVLDGQLLFYTAMQSSLDTAIAWDGQSSTRFPLTERSFHVDVSYPNDGGNILIRSDANKPSPNSIKSLHIGVGSRPRDGSLSSESQNPSPFQTVTTDSKSWKAASDSPIELPSNGWLELDVVASPGTRGWANISDGLDTTRVNLTRIPNNLIGGYSMFGGPVSIASHTPTSIRSLSINALADRGKLIGGENAHPFESVTANTPTLWSVESSEPVTIDGFVQLDLQVEEGAFLKGETSDGTNTTPLIFNGFTEDIQSLWASDVFVAYPEQGGNLMIINGHKVEWISRGVEFNARPGVLEAGDNPSPYAFFFPNSAAPGNVTLGSSGSPATFKEVTELDVKVVPNTLDGDVVAATGHDVIPLVVMPSVERFAASGTGMFCVIPANELVGDLDDNGTVQFRDFLTLAGNFGLDVDTYAEGDINCNGTVDFEDFLRLGNRFGQSRPTAMQPVPEPTGASLFVLGLLSTFFVQRKMQ